jgi:CHAT domain-containing protein
MDQGHETIRDLLRDRLARAASALEYWPDTLVLVLRTLRDQTLFVALNGEDMPLAAIAGKDYSKAARTLAKHIEKEIAAINLTGSAGPDEAIKKKASAAYGALPASIQELILPAQRLLICPDHRAEGGSVPFEMFHDGNGWLGVNKDIARFPNLRTLVRCLEKTSWRSNQKRLLSIAVADVEGFNPLRFAAEEADSVRNTLENQGWDAPVIEQTRVSSHFLLDRLPYATHLHLATHGEARGQREALVLHEGQRLSGTTLLGRFVPTMPTAYINACELGTSRWVGSGRSQSIPYALIGSGCPSVLANLLPVEDQASSALATTFYEHACDADFGRSLMAARGAMANKNINPVFWGTTILVGDPTASFAETADFNTILSQDYLNGLHPANSSELDSDLVESLRMRLLTTPDDVRLSAAIKLAQVIQEWQPDSLNYDMSDICALCHVAYELDHPEWLAFLVFMVHQTMDETMGLELKILFYDNAIRLIEPFKGEASLWSQLLDQLLVAWLHADRGDRVPELQVHGPETDNEDDFLDSAQALIDIQLAMEAREIRSGKGPSARAEENTAEDVLWNAVSASRDYQFEGMPEHYQYARTIVSKLIQLDALPEKTREEATTAFAGLLNWLWRSQNQAQLAAEMIEGQVGVLALLVDSLNLTWKRRAWFKPLKLFATQMTSALQSIEGLPYDDKLYPHIEEVMAQIKLSAEEALRTTEEQHPEHLCAATAWILGYLIQSNTYSYVDGSVPEDLEEKLRDILYELDGQAEARFYPWLMAGYKAVREGEYDELQRWKYDIPYHPTAHPLA